MGPSTKPPATLAATPTTDVEPKASIETGAVARLAAVVTETWLATGAGRNENRRANGVASSSSPATAANESWKLTSMSVLGLTVRSQAAGASHRSQPSLGRDTSVARSPMTPATPARTMEGEAPVTMTYVTTSGRRAKRARHPADAEQHEHEGPHAAQQHHVLARHRQDVQQAAAPEVLDEAVVHALVVAEHHALHDLAHGRREAAPQVAARGHTQAVDPSLQPAAAPDHVQVGQRTREHHVLATAQQVAPVVELPRLRRGRRRDAYAGDAHLGAFGEHAARVADRRRVVGDAQREMRRLVHGHAVRGVDAQGQRQLAGPGLRQVDERAPDGGPAADEAGQAAVIEVRQPQRAHSHAADHEERHDEGRHGSPRSRRRGSLCGGARVPAAMRRHSQRAAGAGGTAQGQHQRARPPDERQAQAQAVAGEQQVDDAGASHRVSHSAAQAAFRRPHESSAECSTPHTAVATVEPRYRVTASLRAANLTSPMPETFLRSSMLLKPPFSVR